MREAEHSVGPRKHDGTALGGKRKAGWFSHTHGRVVAIHACSKHTMETEGGIATVSLKTFHSLEKARWVI